MMAVLEKIIFMMGTHAHTDKYTMTHTELMSRQIATTNITQNTMTAVTLPITWCHKSKPNTV